MLLIYYFALFLFILSLFSNYFPQEITVLKCVIPWELGPHSFSPSIIYGLCDINKDQAPEEIKWITDASKEETIQQILHSRITPKIDVEISTIENPDNKSEFVMVVNVPKSENAPHQDSINTGLKAYWRRRGSIITQMEHYEVVDLFFKRKRPILKIRDSSPIQHSEGVLESWEWHFPLSSWLDL